MKTNFEQIIDILINLYKIVYPGMFLPYDFIISKLCYIK